MTTKPLLAQSRWKIVRSWTYIVVVLPLAIVFIGFVIGPTQASLSMAKQSSTMQQARQIGLALVQYAKDNGSHYPEGKSSTEIFQKLIDGGYVDDPAIFYNEYVPMTGKVRPTGKTLRPENVCWDVTCCLSDPVPDGMPVVFLTGFGVKYQASASAMRIIPLPSPTWYDSILGKVPPHYIAVFYSSISLSDSGGPSPFFSRILHPTEDGSIPNFIPPDFDAKGKIYRQLTP